MALNISSDDLVSSIGNGKAFSKFIKGICHVLLRGSTEVDESFLGGKTGKFICLSLFGLLAFKLSILGLTVFTHLKSFFFKIVKVFIVLE